VVGLGYVGLPLAVEFGKHFDTAGFDVIEGCIAELKAGGIARSRCPARSLRAPRD